MLPSHAVAVQCTVANAIALHVRARRSRYVTAAAAWWGSTVTDLLVRTPSGPSVGQGQARDSFPGESAHRSCVALREFAGSERADLRRHQDTNLRRRLDSAMAGADATVSEPTAALGEFYNVAPVQGRPRTRPHVPENVDPAASTHRVILFAVKIAVAIPARNHDTARSRTGLIAPPRAPNPTGLTSVSTNPSRPFPGVERSLVRRCRPAPSSAVGPGARLVDEG